MKIKSKSEITKEYGVPARITNTSCKRSRTGKHTDVDAALVLWCRTARAQTIPLSDTKTSFLLLRISAVSAGVHVRSP
jgi:hypothetical protein